MNELNFSSDSLKLLDSFLIPVRVIQNNKVIHYNSTASGITDADIDTISNRSSVLWDDESIDYLRISRMTVRVDLKRISNSEHLVLKINYNDIPCHLVISNSDYREFSLKNSVEYINSRKNIKKVFIVDDDPVLIQTYKSIFNLLGYDPVLFDSPVQALEAMKSSDFDLLISDYNMPEINGFELVRNMLEFKPAVPVIICSGLMENFDKTFKLLSNKHHIISVRKPVSIKKINDSLEVVEFVTKLSAYFRDVKNG